MSKSKYDSVFESVLRAIAQWPARRVVRVDRQAFGTLATAGLEGQALLALRTVARAADGQELTCKVLRQAIGKVTTGG